MKTSIPRLRRIRFKDGRTLDVLRPVTSDASYFQRKAFETIATHLANARGQSGVAIVMWDSQGYTVGRVINGMPIPGILIPDLVRNVLLGHKIEDWTIDTLNGN